MSLTLPQDQYFNDTHKNVKYLEILIYTFLYSISSLIVFLFWSSYLLKPAEVQLVEQLLQVDTIKYCIEKLTLTSRSVI